MGRRTFYACSLGILAVGVLVACPPPPEPTPEPEPDGGAATCASMCQHWAALGCEEAEPSPGGVPCVEVCLNVQGSGVLLWDLECRSRVDRCEDIDECERPPR